jgi:hypothetical protein
VILIGARMVEGHLQRRGISSEAVLDKSRGGIAMVMLLLFVFAPTFILALSLRGGLSFTILGIRIRTLAGPAASRFRCLLRSICANLPSLPFLAACAIGFWGGSTGPNLMIAGAATSIAVYVGGAVWSIRSPALGPADRMARTRLVVR